jgi:hypothetical protein
MEHDEDGPPWEGRGERLHPALEDAWNKARAKDAKEGTYKVESILIEVENPIRTYIVTIAPADGD